MIIDSHVHIGTIMDFDLRKEHVLYSMEKYGIDYSIVSDLRAAEFDHQQKLLPKEFQTSQLECARSVIDFAKQNPDSIGAAVWIRPYSEKPDKSIRDLIADNLQFIKAIKFHPFHSTIPFDNKSMDGFVRLAAEFGLPAVVHTGGSDAASCRRVYNMAKRFPEVNFVMVHMGLGTDNSEAIRLIGMLDNLWGDTTWVPVSSTLRFIRENGDDRIIFGSDSPIDGPDTYLHNRTGDRSLYQQYFNELKELVSEKTYDKLMYGNSRRLFRL